MQVFCLGEGFIDASIASVDCRIIDVHFDNGKIDRLHAASWRVLPNLQARNKRYNCFLLITKCRHLLECNNMSIGALIPL